MTYQKFKDKESALAAAEEFHSQFGESILVLKDSKSTEYLIADPVAYGLWREDLQERYEITGRFEVPVRK